MRNTLVCVKRPNDARRPTHRRRLRVIFMVCRLGFLFVEMPFNVLIQLVTADQATRSVLRLVLMDDWRAPTRAYLIVRLGRKELCLIIFRSMMSAHRRITEIYPLPSQCSARQQSHCQRCAKTQIARTHRRRRAQPKKTRPQRRRRRRHRLSCAMRCVWLCSLHGLGGGKYGVDMSVGGLSVHLHLFVVFFFSSLVLCLCRLTAHQFHFRHNVVTQDYSLSPFLSLFLSLSLSLVR